MQSGELNHSEHENCHVLPLDKPASPEQLDQAETAFLLVRGMGCPRCAIRVRNGLLQIEGVVAAEVVLERLLAKVWYDPKVLERENLAALLPAMTADGRHNYSAQLLVTSGEFSADWKIER